MSSRLPAGPPDRPGPGPLPVSPVHTERSWKVLAALLVLMLALACLGPIPPGTPGATAPGSAGQGRTVGGPGTPDGAGAVPGRESASSVIFEMAPDPSLGQARTGTLELRIRWPAQPRFGTQAIPARTRAIRVEIKDASGSVRATMAAVRPESIGTATSSVAARLDVGDGYSVHAEAFAESEPAPGSQAIAVGNASGISIRKAKRTFVYLPLGGPASPRIESLDPWEGWPGLVVTITGGNFGASGNLKLSVTFGGVAAAVERVSDTEIRAIVPEGALTGSVVVVVDGVPSTSAAAFTVVPAPTPTPAPTPSPTPGPAATPVTMAVSVVIEPATASLNAKPAAGSAGGAFTADPAFVTEIALSATVTYSDGSTGSAVVWSSEDVDRVVVSTAGVAASVDGASPGPVTVWATAGVRSGSAQITITDFGSIGVEVQ